MIEWKDELPLIPLRNMVVFPQMIVPLFIGRNKSIKALEEILKKDKMVVFASQKSEDIEEPEKEDIADVGTLAEIVQMLTLPDGTTKILVEGIARAKIEKFIQTKPYFRVEVSRIAESEEVSVNTEALVRIVIKQFEEYVKLNRRIPSETLMSIVNIENPGRLADLITSYLSLKVAERQEVLEAIDCEDRLKKIKEVLEREIDVLGVEKRLQGKVRKQIEKIQKEYYLKEKLRAIQDELGEEEDSAQPEIAEYRKKIKEAKLPENVAEKARKELDRLSKMPSMVAEATVIRTYLDWIVELPWNKKSESKIDIKQVEKILNKEHYGLDKVKERIMEYFAVIKMSGKMGGTILCLVGPPGVGKTSVASSIAKAMGRKFIRVSLGGIRDEAEIRGHRRTYVGSLPGRIIQSIHKVGVSNPVFLLDEIDKIGTDFRGDPASALLEVLDPEQNKSFSDHYLEVDFDLSDVFFITTANTMGPVPQPLRDRMEIIPMSGYTEEEKIEICKGYLIPRELENHGLKSNQVKFTNDVLRNIVHDYTREAGVRSIQRTIAKILRKITVNILKGKKKSKKIFSITKKDLKEYLGAAKYRSGTAEEKDQVGIATGMVWTEVGGDTIPIEVTVMKGRGNLTLTGQLGDVMQESAKAAMSYVRSRSSKLDLDPNFYRKYDIHIHVPEGAVPKDGPSAGITIAAALTSALTGKVCKKDIAMTGEITLRGKVLPIGGLKEKILGARRAGIKHVVIPDDNRKDIEEIEDEIPEDMKITFVKDMDQVLTITLGKKTRVVIPMGDDDDSKSKKLQKKIPINYEDQLPA